MDKNTMVNPRVNTFIKLNILGTISGLFFFIAVESGLNIFRIERLTGFGFNTLKNIYVLFYIIGFILGSGILISLIRKWMRGKLSRFWIAFIWFPYFLLFNYISTYLFPFTSGGDVPSSGTGLIILLGIIFYPFYLIFINLFAMNE